MSDGIIHWRSPGPVAEGFLDSRAFIVALMGPVGSAKTTTALMRLVAIAKEQAPSPKDGIRRFKACVVCKTYRTLWKNLLPSWWHIMSKETGTWAGSEGGPATHRIDFGASPDAVELEFWIDFIAIGDNRAEDVLRGYEPTVFLLEEADLLDFDTFQYCVSRVGRYPKTDDGGPTYRGVALIFNAPDTENYCYLLCVEKKTPDGKPIETIAITDQKTGAKEPLAVEFFRQPGGLSAGAENLANLDGGRAYYERMSAVMEEWAVRRMVHNQFGYSRDGKPVFPEYDDIFHVSPVPLDPITGLPLILGLDAGGSPAAVVKQHLPNGQWRTLHVMTSEHGTGPERFAENLNRLLAGRFPEWAAAPRRPFAPGRSEGAAILAAVDPSAFFGGDKKNLNDRAWAQKVAAETGLALRPAPTNLLVPRLTAVRQTFIRNIDGRTPGYLMDPRCAVLRKAYASEYRYLRVRAPGAARFHDEPEKNDHSHPADADQYAMLTFGEYHAAMGRREARRGAPLAESAELD
jgi:hypothetical protein